MHSGWRGVRDQIFHGYYTRFAYGELFLEEPSIILLDHGTNYGELFYSRFIWDFESAGPILNSSSLASFQPVRAMLLAMSSTTAIVGGRQKESSAIDQCKIVVVVEDPSHGGQS